MVFEKSMHLHNVAELVHDGEHDGLRMQRVPESLRRYLNAGAQQKVLDPAAVELRFVLEGRSATVTLSTPADPVEIDLFFGDLDGKQRFVVGNTPTTIEISVPENQVSRMGSIPGDVSADLPFSTNVIRLRPYYKGPLYLHSVTGAMRPPHADELPAKTLLAYGTSITHGADASRPYLTWPAMAAWRLGADVINLGVGGSCHAEHEFADYIASRTDWDLALFGLSVNMVGAGFTLEAFTERTTYLLRTVSQAHPEKPIFAISLFPYFADWDPALQENAKGEPAEFREALAASVEATAAPNVHLIDGRDLLSFPAGLTVDLIHPSDLGMIQIGERIATRVREVTDA